MHNWDCVFWLFLERSWIITWIVTVVLLFKFTHTYMRFCVFRLCFTPLWRNQKFLNRFRVCVCLCVLTSYTHQYFCLCFAFKPVEKNSNVHLWISFYLHISIQNYSALSYAKIFLLWLARIITLKKCFLESSDGYIYRNDFHQQTRDFSFLKSIYQQRFWADCVRYRIELLDGNRLYRQCTSSSVHNQWWDPLRRKHR